MSRLMPSGRTSRWTGTVVLTAALVLTVTPPADAASRADLTVSKSTMTITGNRVTGSFTTKNTGRATARHPKAVIQLASSRRILRTYALRSITRSKHRTTTYSAPLPTGLSPGTRSVRVCLDPGHHIRERSETNNCRTIGIWRSKARPAPPPPPAPRPPPRLTSFAKEEPIRLQSALTPYWAWVPDSYSTTHTVPTSLLVWLHGCGGESAGDIWNVHPRDGQRFISIAVGGAEGGCWNLTTGQAYAKAAIKDVEAKFNINPRRIIIGGYSSGGDLAYRTAFYDARKFAGVLAINTSPFRDTGSTSAQSLAAVGWRFPVVHVLHTDDTTYPRTTVLAELAVLSSHGFPVTTIERPGTHYDDGPDGTDADIRSQLLTTIDTLGWLSPP